MTSSSYSNKPDNYFGNPRTEIKTLLPTFSEKVLEIGCGTGATLAWIKSNRKCSTTFGVELFEDAAAQAKASVDHVMVGNIEQHEFMFAHEQFDLILLLDVLEHLVDPWEVLTRLVNSNLKNGGVVIASIPNIRYYHALGPLLFKGQWEYEDSGVLDRTHLRFFTKKSALELITGAELDVSSVLSLPVGISTKWSMLNLATLNLFRDFMTQQYVLKAVKKKVR